MHGHSCKIGYKAAKNIVFFGGAGVSTESGHSRFPQRGRAIPPILPLSAGNDAQPHLFPAPYCGILRILPRQDDFPTVHSPTPRITRWHAGKRTAAWRAVVTQNIDGLHQLAGSQNVLELHGSIYRNHCMRLRQILSALRHRGKRRRAPLRMRRYHQAGCSAL